MMKRLPERRSALITVGGIAAVIVAGAFAVGANLGILHASADNQLGELAAAGDLVPTAGPTPGPVTTVAAPPITTALQTYLVDVAGTVALDATSGTLVVSAVSANPGWTWTEVPYDATHVELVFTDGVRTLVFTATRAADGSVDARVDETTSDTAPIAPAATAPSSHEDSDDHEQNEEHGDEHQGRDDDD